MNYNERNRHPRDARLEFEPESHTYRVDGEVFDSVTTVVEDMFERFDAEYWATRKATPGHPREMILREWAAKGELARNLGTEMHDRIERYYLGEPVEQWMTDGTLCALRLLPAMYAFVPHAPNGVFSMKRRGWRELSTCLRSTRRTSWRFGAGNGRRRL